MDYVFIQSSGVWITVLYCAVPVV